MDNLLLVWLLVVCVRGGRRTGPVCCNDVADLSSALSLLLLLILPFNTSAGKANRCANNEPDSGILCLNMSVLLGVLSKDMANTIFRSKNATPTQRTTMITRKARAVSIRHDLNPSLLLDDVDADSS